jgi:hypothetical protein
MAKLSYCCGLAIMLHAFALADAVGGWFRSLISAISIDCLDQYREPSPSNDALD